MRPPNIEKKPPWRSRGYLPHFDRPGLVQSVTFRLADSLPRHFIEQCREDLRRIQRARRPAERARQIESYLDRGAGACHLRQPPVAAMVEEALLRFDGERYRLLAWCVMPNHVHVVIEMMATYRLDAIVHSWKSFTAKEANHLLGLGGSFWQREYYDRFIRDEEHLANAIRYIVGNAVSAGLVERPEDWRWCSAWQGRRIRES